MGESAKGDVVTEENKPSIGNAKVEIEVTSPLVRPGLVLRTWVSEKYAANAAKAMLNIVREINGN